jgi:outer membrane protein
MSNASFSPLALAFKKIHWGFLKFMKKLCAILLLSTVVSISTPAYAADKLAAPSIGIVSFKHCLENSKIGKQEQARFDQMRKQMEQTIEQKEKALKELSPKFSEEYLDSLTPEAEAELKDTFKNLSQELTQLQNQYYQSLNQTNMQVVQKMYDLITEASKSVAHEKGLDLILNEESCFYKADALDVSAQVVQKLDAATESEKK